MLIGALLLALPQMYGTLPGAADDTAIAGLEMDDDQAALDVYNAQPAASEWTRGESRRGAPSTVRRQ